MMVSFWNVKVGENFGKFKKNKKSLKKKQEDYKTFSIVDQVLQNQDSDEDVHSKFLYINSLK